MQNNPFSQDFCKILHDNNLVSTGVVTSEIIYILYKSMQLFAINGRLDAKQELLSLKVFGKGTDGNFQTNANFPNFRRGSLSIDVVEINWLVECVW